MAKKNVSTPTLSNNMRKEGWEYLKHVKRSITSISKLNLVPVLKKGENCIGSAEMLRRARVELNANLGQEDAEFLLQHQEEIPKKWRNYYISFPGTVFFRSDGYLGVPSLRWDGGRWYLWFFWL